jgi:hypothetical protein
MALTHKHRARISGRRYASTVTVTGRNGECNGLLRPYFPFFY